MNDILHGSRRGTGEPCGPTVGPPGDRPAGTSASRMPAAAAPLRRRAASP